MKISYILQMKDFSILFILGIIVGIIYEFLNISQIIKNNYIIQIFSDIIFCLIFTIIFIFAINIINLGEFRIFLLFAYYLGFTIERITLGKLFAKGFKLIYNKLIILWKRFLKCKIGRFIFK